MGMSTNAILGYGYIWNEELTLVPGFDGEWEAVVAKKRGFKDPWDDYPTELEKITDYRERLEERKKWINSREKELDFWSDKLKEIEKEFGVKVGYHCSGTYAMPYVAAWVLEASRGNPEKVPDPLVAEVEWDRKLDKWLEEFGIEKPHVPHFFLCSYWSC